ncbi:MAG: type II toxin-antitoxin system RelE/ParE family toxin [Flavobacteriales bacterium]|nr:type II toxin-antitoxin system RelE/ParE family toxin [Flavobacteriales bacterium]
MMRLPMQERRKVVNKIDRLAADPRPPGCLKLKGRTEELWRIRSGDYRILYAIDDVIRIVDVRQVGNRREVYR